MGRGLGSNAPFRFIKQTAGVDEPPGSFIRWFGHIHNLSFIGI